MSDESHNIINKRNILRVLSFVPLFLVLSMIFSFSSQSGSTSTNLSRTVAIRLVSIADSVFDISRTSEEVYDIACDIEFYVRKGAHITEFAMLTFGFWLPCLWIFKSNKWRFAVCIAFPLVCAILDEIHQLFVWGRAGRGMDVLIDSIGIAFVDLVMWAVLAIGRKRKNF